jgi:8-oxo-dGTP pyrophosphatase MutT (NUDIX family)
MGRAMPKRDRSAGFVCFREEPDSGIRKWLLLDHGGHWDFPKGHVAPGESDLDAAIRELREETSLVPVEVLDGFCQSLSYYFRSPKRGLLFKTVTFYLARVNDDPVLLSGEHVAFDFLPFHDALRRLSFASTREVLRSASARVERGLMLA